MAINRPKIHTPEHILNKSFDNDYQILMVEGVVEDGAGNLVRQNSTDMAMKVTTVGDITYMGFASPGADEASAVWQAKKIDTSSGVSITWADGNSSFDNVATDLTALTYS